MITKENFLVDFPGASKSYSNFYVIGKTVDEVIECLNKLGVDPDYIGSGQESEHGVEFRIFGVLPELIYDITGELHCTGFADVDWDECYFAAAKDGDEYDDFRAEWVDGCPFVRDEGGFDAFCDVIDNESGARFSTGAGAVGTDTKNYFEDLVNSHKGGKR